MLLGILLTVPAAPILDRSEHGSWNILIAHLSGAFAEETISQQFAGHDGGRSELNSTVDHISNCIDVRNSSKVIISSDDLAVGSCLNADCL